MTSRKYNEDLNTKLVQYLNGQKEVGCQMPFEYQAAQPVEYQTARPFEYQTYVLGSYTPVAFSSLAKAKLYTSNKVPI